MTAKVGNAFDRKRLPQEREGEVDAMPIGHRQGHVSLPKDSRLEKSTASWHRED